MSFGTGLRHVFSFLSLSVVFAAFAPVAQGQPIQLLKDLRYGFWPEDSREIVQLATTSESIVMVTKRRYGSYYDAMFHLNVTDGTDTDYHYGFPLGEDDNFGFGITPDGNGMDKYPFFCLRDDNRIIFSYAYHTNYSRFVELDPATQELKPLTKLGYTPNPLASWNLPDGNIGFVRKGDGQPLWEVCRFNPEVYDSIEVTTSIPFLKPAAASSIQVGPVRLLGDVLLFTAVEEDGKTVSVYRTDGTEAGSAPIFSSSGDQVKDICMVEGLGKIFFGVNQGTGPSSLYATDGTLAGTSLVSDTLDSQFRVRSTYEATESSSTLFWMNPVEDRIFATDGSTVRELPAVPNPELLLVAVACVQEQLYITTFDSGYYGKSLYASDGLSTPSKITATTGLSSIYASASSSSGTLVYTDYALYLVNGPLSIATPLVYYSYFGDGTSYFPHLAVFRNQPIFNRRKTRGQQTDQLFMASLGKPYQPFRITNFTQIPISSDPGDFTNFNGRLLCTQTAFDNEEIRGYTYVTEGTPDTTTELFDWTVKSIGIGKKGVLHLLKTSPWEDAPYQNAAVYSTDGTQFSFREILNEYNITSQRPIPTPLFDDNEMAYVGYYQFSPTQSVFVTDGQMSARTNLLVPIPTKEPLIPIGLVKKGLYERLGIVAAVTAAPNIPTYQIFEIRGSNLSSQSYKIADSITRPTAGVQITSTSLIYGATRTGYGEEIMVTDGTANGTKLFKDLMPGTASSSPREFTKSGNLVFFTAIDPAVVDGSVRRLWTSDGTAAGTLPVPGELASFTADTSVTLTVREQGGVYVQSIDETSVNLLYSNGTADGTRVLYSGPAASEPDLLAEVNGKMFLALTTPDLGRELYRTAGVTGGVELVQDLAPGKASGAVMKDAGVLGNRLFFAGDARDGFIGREIYYLDVTESSVADWELY